MTRSRWIIFIVTCIVVLGGLILLTKKDSVNVDDLDPSKAVSETETTIGDHVYGNASAKVVLIEYGDFQCPGCGGAFPQLKTIKETYKDTVAFIFRDFPLTTIHPNALAAATAAEAASLQGKFWEMHDALYENQSAWSDIEAAKRTDVFAGYARDIGLDVEKFKTDLNDTRVAANISRDRAFGQKLGISGTPSLYIGDQKLSADENNDLVQKNGDKLRDKLDAALKAAGVEPPKRS
jgi:protein-disulfide isomerase